MRPHRAPQIAAIGMALALMLMLACLLHPSARMVGAFLGIGLPIAGASVIVFGGYVLRDLRRHRIL